MPDLKIDFKNLGTIRLLPLDTSSLLLPFGRPIADYLRGVTGAQNGTRALVRQGATDFSPLIRWTASTVLVMRTTGFGDLERAGVIESAAKPAGPADPGVADFLSSALPGVVARDASPAKAPSPMTPADVTIAKPRIAALPLRPRMTFGPPPLAKAKVAPAPTPALAPPPKALAPPTTVKPAPTPVGPSKPSPVPPPKPVTPAKVIAPTTVQVKPVTVIPPAPRPAAAPPLGPRVTAPQSPATPVSAPVARTPETRRQSQPRLLSTLLRSVRRPPVLVLLPILRLWLLHPRPMQRLRSIRRPWLTQRPQLTQSPAIWPIALRSQARLPP